MGNVDLEFNQRFSRNLISNIVFFIISLFIGLAIVPFFLDTLGAAAYALIPLATSITSYVVIIIDAVNTSVMRYLALDLQSGDKNASLCTFNSSLFGTLAISLLMIPVIIVIAGASPLVFDTGSETYGDVFLLFFFIFLAAVIRFLGNPFMVTLFSYNRLDFRNYVNITYVSLQFVLTLTIFILLNPSLPLLGISYIISSLVSVFLSIILSRKVCPELTISISHVSKKRSFEMMKTSGWAVINKIGALLRLQISIIVVNILFGAIAETEFSLAFTWFTLLTTISAVLINVFIPQLYAFCSKNDTKGLIQFSKTIVRLVSEILILPLGLVCIFTPQLLSIWVGEEYAFLTPLVWIIILPLLIRTPGNIIYPLIIAYNKIHIAAIVSISVGILNLVLSISIPLVMNNGYYGVAYAWFISTVLEAVICLAYMAYVLRVPLRTYLVSALPSICCYLILMVIGYCINIIFYPQPQIFSLALCGGLISIIYLFLLFTFIFNKDEKKLVCDVLPNPIKKIVCR